MQKGIFSIYLWSINISVKVTVQLTEMDKKPVSEIFLYLRKMYSEYFLKYPIRLGGEGIVCKIDESLFIQKQKYHRGRPSEHQTWVFGIVDTSYSPYLGYMTIVERRNATTLLPIISEICLPGTIIYSDQWAAYNNISSLGFEHQTVNHSLNFINPETGVHTQNIESFWNKQKLRIKKMKAVRRSKLQSYLNEYLWKDRFQENAFFKISGVLDELN